MAGNRRVAAAIRLKASRQLLAECLAGTMIAVGHRGGQLDAIRGQFAGDVDRLETRSQEQGEIVLFIAAAVRPGSVPERHMVGHKTARLRQFAAQQAAQRRCAQVARIFAVATHQGVDAGSGMAGIRTAEGANDGGLVDPCRHPRHQLAHAVARTPTFESPGRGHRFSDRVWDPSSRTG